VISGGLQVYEAHRDESIVKRIRPDVPEHLLPTTALRADLVLSCCTVARRIPRRLHELDSPVKAVRLTDIN
jgi:hypothetical protein